jgi:hypothetical protein
VEQELDDMGSMNALVEQVTRLSWIDGPITTALYPSSASDTYPITLTHPAFLAKKGLSGVPAPNLFVYVDRKPQFGPPGANPRCLFEDSRTRILLHSAQSGPDGIQVLGLSAESHRLPTRRVVIAFLQRENQEVAEMAYLDQWVPDVFIGVCDGCGGFGGNDRSLCVNRLSTHGLTRSRPQQTPIPRWWITDHFVDHDQTSLPVKDGYVTSTEDGFPYRFKALARLSEQWGGYRNWSLGGTWLFEVQPVTDQDATS